MTDATDLGFGANVVDRSGDRGAVCWRGSRSKRKGVVSGQKEVSKHVCLVVEEGKGGEKRID